jgi:hypothetical protein
MVNELVARAIVAGRTEAALRAANERQLIAVAAGRRPVPTVRRWRWSARSPGLGWLRPRGRYTPASPRGKTQRRLLACRYPAADLVETATKHSTGTFSSDTCGAHVITHSDVTEESRPSSPKEIRHEPQRTG